MNYNIDLDVTPSGVPQIVKLSQYDKTIPQIQATLWDGVSAYTMPTGATCYVAGTKPDNTGFEYQVSNSGNVVTIPVTEQMTAVAGRVPTEVIIMTSDGRKGSANFFLDVEPAALSEDTSLSETDIPIIEQLPEKLEEAKTYANKAHQWATYGSDSEQPSATNNAKYYAEQAAQTDIGQATTISEVSDTAPYLFRSSTANAEYDELVGVSVVENQLVPNGNFASASGWAAYSGTISVSNNKCVLTPTSAFNTGISANIVNTNNHIVLTKVSAKTVNDISGTIKTRYPFNSTSQTLNNQLKDFLFVGQATTDTTLYFQCGLSELSDVEFSNVKLIDLTLAFGPSVADLIYSMEQETAGSGIAYLKSLGLITDGYEAYNVGTMASSQPVSRKVYDSDENLKVTYPLGSDTLRGLLTVVNNKIVANGDVKTSDGVITRKYFIVNLGDLPWEAENNNVFRSMQNATVNKMKFRGNILCTKYIKGIATSVQEMVDKEIEVLNSQEIPIFRVRDTSYSDAATFKTAMDGVYALVELATPTTEQSTPFAYPQVVMDTEEIVSDVPCGHNATYVTLPSWMDKKIINDLVAEATKVADIEEALPSKVEESNIAPVENGSTASTSYSVGALIMRNGTLYKVISQIASGGTFTVGTNIQATTLADVIASL